MAYSRTEPAIGSGDHVLATDQVGVAHQTLGYQVRVLDKIRAMADHTGDEGGAFRQLDTLEYPPLMLVTGV